MGNVISGGFLRPNEIYRTRKNPDSILPISASTFWLWVSLGRIKTHRLSRGVTVVARADVEKLIQSGERS